MSLKEGTFHAVLVSPQCVALHLKGKQGRGGAKNIAHSTASLTTYSLLSPLWYHCICTRTTDQVKVCANLYKGTVSDALILGEKCFTRLGMSSHMRSRSTRARSQTL